jgi:UDP-2-acetamido-2,6-beta-L-arabino-hexul-4-ose reductase
MRVLVTGANGFLGRNLMLSLREKGHEVLCFTRDDHSDHLADLVGRCDAVFHLAGVNRPDNLAEFEHVNHGLTKKLADSVVASGKSPAIVLASSTHAAVDNPYGRSKRAAEAVLEDLAEKLAAPILIFRLPGIFGKWGRPDYNSVVNTFCHNIARGMPIRVDDPERAVRLVYVDDVIDAFVSVLGQVPPGLHRPEIEPVYSTTLGELAAIIGEFRESRTNLVTDRVGTGLTRALYATYVSYVDPADFHYPLKAHADARGRFVEMLRTRDSGQFSFFTAGPGITRGGHYHHSKTEKFLVLKGKARFRFRCMLTNRRVELITEGEVPEVVDTAPGWAHDITNIGTDELIVMLWANEGFDPDRPDTYASAVQDV